MSNFADAVRQLLEAHLRCPRCGACNAPGRTYIELQPSRLAFCSVCAHSWTLSPEHVNDPAA